MFATNKRIVPHFNNNDNSSKNDDVDDVDDDDDSGVIERTFSNESYAPTFELKKKESQNTHT